MKKKLAIIICFIFMFFSFIYLYNLSYAGINDYYGASADETNQLLFNKVKKLQEYANSYRKEKGVSTSASELCMQYIRKDSYNSKSWTLMIGSVDSNFVSYVSSKDSSFKITSSDKLIDEKTGAKIDFIHMIASLNAVYKPNILVDSSYAGWAGDLMTLMQDVINYRVNNGISDTSKIQEHSNSLLGTDTSSSFNKGDALADLDAINIGKLSTLSSDLYQTLVDYYIDNDTTNCSYKRFESAQKNLGSKSNIISVAKERLSNSLMQDRLIGNVKSKITSSDINILANSFAEYVYREPYIELASNSTTVNLNATTSVNMSGRNTDNVTLSYDTSIVSVTNNGTSVSIKGLKLGSTSIKFNSPENKLKATLNITVKNVPPSISKNLNTSESLTVGTNKTLSFTAGGTNNKYTWYLSDSSSSNGSVYKETTSASITISPSLDLNNKYLKCAVSNEGNSTVYTNSVKLSVKDAIPTISSNLSSSTSMVINTNKTISFSVNGNVTKYTWYLSDSSSSNGSVYKTTDSPSITITPSFDLNNKYLKCAVSSFGNSDVYTSATKIVVKDVAPSITKNLSGSVEMVIGTNKTISFTASGTNNKYTWYLSDSSSSNGSVYKTTNSPSITIAPSNDLNNKYLKCAISNTGNSTIYTNAVKLSVKQPAPTISANLPTSSTLSIGINKTFKFSVSGSNVTKYTWYLSDSSSSNGSVYKTTSKPELSIKANNFELNGKYLKCAISSNGYSDIFTNSVKLTIKDVEPSIVTNLSSSANLSIGNSTKISFSANGTNNKYTWYLSDNSSSNGSVYKTTSSPEITITPNDFSLNNKYLRCSISNTGNSTIYTSYIKLNISDKMPTIVVDLPNTINMNVNSTTKVTFSTNGTNNKYTWYILKNENDKGTVYKTTSSPELSLTDDNFSLNGKYLKCGISNTGNNEIFTTISKIEVIDTKPVITQDLPSTTTITEGSNSTIKFVSSGTNNVYTWYLSNNSSSKGEVYKKTNTSEITLSPDEYLNDKYLSCEVTNTSGEKITTTPVKLSYKKKEVSPKPSPVKPKPEETVPVVPEEPIVDEVPSETPTENERNIFKEYFSEFSGYTPLIIFIIICLLIVFFVPFVIRKYKEISIIWEINASKRKYKKSKIKSFINKLKLKKEIKNEKDIMDVIRKKEEQKNQVVQNNSKVNSQREQFINHIHSSNNISDNKIKSINTNVKETKNNSGTSKLNIKENLKSFKDKFIISDEKDSKKDVDIMSIIERKHMEQQEKRHVNKHVPTPKEVFINKTNISHSSNHTNKFVTDFKDNKSDKSHNVYKEKKLDIPEFEEVEKSNND